MTQRLAHFVALLLLLGSAAAADAAQHRYMVRISDGLDSIEVRACFDTAMPRALKAFDPRAEQGLRFMRVVGAMGSEPVEVRQGRARLSGITAPACIEYAVDLDDAIAAGWRGGMRRGPDSLVLSPHRWLWFPAPQQAGRSIQLSFTHPPDMNVSAPWELISRERGRTVYRIGGRPYEWDARIAMGRFEVDDIRLPGGVLRLAVLDGSPSPDREAIRRWVEEGARALAEVSGGMPVPGVQVLVVPIGRGGEPVPWGQVMRGGGDAVHLYVDQRRPYVEFRDDWTLVHELSHLLHPKIDGRDAWLYEGLASYYQNVLRARVGLLEPQEAWEELHAGFQRGIRGTPRDLTLAEVSENMPRNHMYMRVYWSGAAIALLADAELRGRSPGRQSLDTALAALAACCLPSEHLWSGLQVMSKLDALTGTDVFTRLYTQQAYSTEFPDLRDTYERLGLSPTGHGLRLLDDAPEAQIRRAIMRSATRGS